MNIHKKSRYPVIAPVAEGIERPFWSVMIPSYNCGPYLEQTLRSVLEQDPGSGKMQIEVVDDCSTTYDPEKIVKEVGRGRVSFFRQPRNKGAVPTFTTCVERANGHWVHILHGDDLVLPGFYESYEKLARDYSYATLLTGPSIYIDERGSKIGESEPMSTQDGPVADFAIRQALRNCMRTPSVVIPRKVYEKIGAFYSSLCHTADWELFFRAGIEGQAVTTTRICTAYRVHPESDTRRLILNGYNIKESAIAIRLCCNRLPKRLRQGRISATKYHWLAGAAKEFSHDLANKRYWRGSFIHASWALKLRPNIEHLRVWVHAFIRYLKYNPVFVRIIASSNHE